MPASAKDLEVYEAIRSLVVNQEFLQQQSAFYEKVMDIFELPASGDVAENKIEYTNCYEEYVYIVEQQIDAKLKEKFTPAEVEHFYTSFKEPETLKQYQEIDKQVVDQLFQFVDFEKFKQSVFYAKKAMEGKLVMPEEETKLSNELSSLDEHEVFQFMKEDLSGKDPKYKWRKALVQDEIDGMSITVYQRPLEGSRTHMTRSDIIYKGITGEMYGKLFEDYDKTYKDFDPKNVIKEFKFIEKNEKGSVVYVRFKMGKLMSDRDSLTENKFHMQTEGENAGYFVILTKSCEHDDVPEIKGVVRMNQTRAILMKTVDGDLHVHEFQNMDLKGYFPSSLLNMGLATQCQTQASLYNKRLQKMKAEQKA